ncbi:MAG: hypothetical protein LBU91_07020 [Bacteroidales bacterium]|jgi:hypothetical protein|nr:hypothetical protein [Bacteroidales bacterium]
MSKTNLGYIETTLNNVAFFGIESRYSRIYNMAFYLNQFLDIKLENTIDFDSYATKKRVSYPSYIYTSEADHCTCYLIGNKGENTLFKNYPDIDFWFLAELEGGLNDSHFVVLQDKLCNKFSLQEHVFALHEVKPKTLEKFADFEFDFLDYKTKLVYQRQQEERQNRL